MSHSTLEQLKEVKLSRANKQQEQASESTGSEPTATVKSASETQQSHPRNI
jgi:hypothetical protein